MKKILFSTLLGLLFLSIIISLRDILDTTEGNAARFQLNPKKEDPLKRERKYLQKNIVTEPFIKRVEKTNVPQRVVFTASSDCGTVACKGSLRLSHAAKNDDFLQDNFTDLPSVNQQRNRKKASENLFEQPHHLNSLQHLSSALKKRNVFETKNLIAMNEISPAASKRSSSLSTPFEEDFTHEPAVNLKKGGGELPPPEGVPVKDSLPLFSFLILLFVLYKKRKNLFSFFT